MSNFQTDQRLSCQNGKYRNIWCEKQRSPIVLVNEVVVSTELITTFLIVSGVGWLSDPSIKTCIQCFFCCQF